MSEQRVKAWHILVAYDWCQHHFAVDINGDQCSIYGDAVAYCGLGVLRLRYGDFLAGQMVAKLQERLGCLLTEWQDKPGRIKEEVVTLLKELDL